MAKTCIICGSEETRGCTETNGSDEASRVTLLEAPCQRHWVCTDDVGSYFERATESESLYPPKCCGQIFLLDTYEAHIPFEVQWAFQMKEQGEYSVLAKYRVYCANPSCSQFLSPATHVKDPSSNISYAVCQDDACGKLTCTNCKTLLDCVEGHTCDQNEDYKKFKQTATEKGFQECPTCASTVELAEACNHITCECGAEFCYICGQQWQGMHGCPHYGPAIYDEEGYNQDGFHQTTGLNREGRTRREQGRIDREEQGDDDEENDDEEDDDPDANHFVLQHVEPGIRATFAALPHEEREMFLLNLQIQLFEERGITFPDPGDEGGGRDGDSESDGEDHDDSASDDGSDEEGGSQDGEEEAGQTIEDEDDDNAGQNEDGQTDGQADPHPGNAGPDVLSIAATMGAMQTIVESTEQAVLDNTAATEATQNMSQRRVIHSALNASNDSTGQTAGSNSPDEDQPTTPMDIDPVAEQDKEERPAWQGPPGGWSIDEEL